LIHVKLGNVQLRSKRGVQLVYRERYGFACPAGGPLSVQAKKDLADASR
jgi:hypothetical protein